MTTLAPRDDKIMKVDNTPFPNLFDTLTGENGSLTIDVSSLTIDVNSLTIDTSNALFTGNIECEKIQLNDSLSLQGTGGQMVLSNVVTSATAGATAGAYLRVVVNGTLRKISLLPAT